MRRFESIDILRGFAALSVVVYHAIEHFQWADFPRTGPLLWFRIGWLGVDLFFVISGFVISLTAFAGIDRLGVPGFREPFAAHRLFRIAPLHYLTCLLFVAFVVPALLLREDVVEQILAHLIFVHNLDPLTRGVINGPNWSVGTEMQFYLLVLLFAPWLRVAPPWRIAAIFVVIAMLWRATVFYLVPIDPVSGAQLRFVYSTQLPGSLDLFAVGILLARFTRSEHSASMTAMLGRYSSLVFTVVAASLVSLTLRMYWMNADYWPSFTMVTFFRTAIAIAAGAVVLAATSFNHSMWIRVTAPLRYLGTISYGIYLWHILVIQSLKRIPSITAPVALPLTIGLTLLLAATSWHFFEKPLIARSGSLGRLGPYVTPIGYAVAAAMVVFLVARIAATKFNITQ